MSLYEPSIRSSTWSFVSRRYTRPLTTLSGWREIGLGVYALGPDLKMFSLNHQFDPDLYRPEPGTQTLPARLDAVDMERLGIPPIPGLRSESPGMRSVQSYGHLMRPPAPPIAVASPRRFQEIRLGIHGEKRKEVWSDVLPAAESQQQGERREDPYNVFSKRKRWCFVTLVAIAGMVPGLTPYMYIPTLNSVTTDLRTGLETAATTITSYLFFQGVAALLWGPLSDSIGRRSTYILTFGLYIASTVALSFSPNLVFLVVFRALQAMAIASTVSISSAVVQDICAPSERSSFLNLSLGLRDITTVIAPVLGGLLSTFLGFRSIFVFLWSFSLAILVFIVIFLPETLRSIAGNGSVRLPAIHQPLIVKFGLMQDWEVLPNDTSLDPRTKLSAVKFLEPFHLLKEKDILMSLVFGGIVYAIWMMLIVSTPGLFRKSFQLNDLLIGVSLIPSAVGAIAGSTLMGNVMHRDFLYAGSKYKAEHSLAPSQSIKTQDMPADFPLEHTRLRQLPIVLPIFVVTLSGYGFTLAYPEMTKRPGWILLPLFLQFVIAASANAICAMHQTMVSDLWYQNGRASVAIATLVKCMIAALGVGLTQVMLDGVGNWSTFVALGLVVMVLVPLPVALWYWGLDWRAEREARCNILSRVGEV